MSLYRDRPVLSVAVAALRLEVEVGEAQRQAPPDVGLSAQAAGAHPGIVAARVGVLFLVDDDVLRVVGAAPALHVRVDRRVFQASRIRRRADVVFVEGQRMMPGRHVAAARVLVGPFHRLELLVDVELAARFEQQHLHPLRGEDVGGHAPGGTRANDDGVVDAGEVGLGLWRALDQSKKTHVLNRGASPLGLPYTRSRSPLRRLAPSAWLTRAARSRSTEGLRPSDSPTRALTRRFDGSLRARGSLARLVRVQPRGFAPRTPPTRALARRFDGSLRARGSLARLVRVQPRGFAPRTPLHALSLAASTARSERVAHSRGSFAFVARTIPRGHRAERARSESAG